MKRLILIFIALTILVHAQSLQETFEWMTNTLQPPEENNYYIHHPNRQPYPKGWVEKHINPYHKEIIRNFSYDECRVKIVVEVVDNDMGSLLGKQFDGVETDTFGLKDIDPTSVKVHNSCEPFDTNEGKANPLNCEDDAGLVMEFKAVNAKPNIHRELVTSSYKSDYGFWEVEHDPEHSLDKLCKEIPKNEAYCDTTDIKQPLNDVTSSSLGFSNPAYTKRFIKAFQHAIELCGGKKSVF